MKPNICKSQPASFRGRNGFSLIEVIGALVLISILIVMLLPLMGSGLKGSRHALLKMPATHNLRTEMDAIWHLYNTTRPIDLPALHTTITNGAASNSASYNLDYIGWVNFDSAGVESTPSSGTGSVLKVTLASNSGEKLTAFFFPTPTS